MCLEKLKEIANLVPHIYRNNERLVAMLEIQAYYNLSSIDGTYLEKANNAYAIVNDINVFTKRTNKGKPAYRSA